MPYIEQHHFVLQEIYRNFVKVNPDSTNIDKLYKLVYSPTNIVLLCPRCHRRIHQGTENDVNEMINELLNSNKELLNNTKSIAEILGIDYEKLISNMYDVNFTLKKNF